MATDLPRPSEAARLRAANLRTGIALGVVAALFFCGVLVAEYIGGPLTAIAVTGTAVLAFLAVGIGRHLRKPPE